MRMTLLAALSTVALASPAMAVILYSTPVRNTSAPTGSLAGSGWQYQGDYRGFSGTAIGPRHFITANHIGIPGFPETYTYQGQNYTTSTVTRLAGTDLAIVEVTSNLPNWAPLYNPSTDGSEVGKDLVVFGRGSQRGDEILTTVGNGGSPVSRNTDNPELRGWLWGADDRVRSWGTNTVTTIANGGPDYGNLVYFEFNAEVGGNESMFSGGDSGGGVFINVNGTWKLAGVNFSVDGPFRYSETGPGFLGAIFDAGGLWIGDQDPQYIADEDTDIAAGSYATRIGSNLSAITSILAAGGGSVPEPASTIVLLGATALLLRRNRA